MRPRLCTANRVIRKNLFNMETRNCQNCKKEFTIEPDDFSFYEKMKVPPPTWCPECRMIRRFAFRNERNLFRRKDAHTGEEIFSGFSPDADVTTYKNSHWFDSDWDQLATGVDYDFNTTFFEQLRLLLERAPIMSLSVLNMINSDYCNEASEAKNCYLCFNCDYMENSAYLRKTNHMKDCFDFYEGSDNELCYEDVMVDKSYSTHFSVDCENCVDVWFSKGLRGCTDCFGSVNLSKKSNYFFNQPYSREEYNQKVAQFKLTSYENLLSVRKQVEEFWLRFPVKYNHTLRILDSTGERVFDCKNVKDSYSIKKSENLRYCQDVQHSATNSYDYSVWGEGSENMYECMTCGLGAFNIKFCFNCWKDTRDLEYCIYSLGSNNCFGCVGLYKKEYCILNKQYTKEEYFTLRDRIITHMNEVPYTDTNNRIYKYGEFFPYDISPVSYNESIAQDFFPLEKEAAQNQGYSWREPINKEYNITIRSIDLPDDLNNTKDSVLTEIIECAECKKAYRIISLELQFYRRIGVSLPRICQNCRFIKRFKFINPPKLWPRSCMCTTTGHEHNGRCENKFETSYSPDRSEIVYCEKCYQQEVN